MSKIPVNTVVRVTKDIQTKISEDQPPIVFARKGDLCRVLEHVDTEMYSYGLTHSDSPGVFLVKADEIEEQ